MTNANASAADFEHKIARRLTSGHRLFNSVSLTMVQHDIAKLLMLETVFYVSGVNILSCHQVLNDRFCDKAFRYAFIREGILDIGVYLFLIPVIACSRELFLLLRGFDLSAIH